MKNFIRAKTILFIAIVLSLIICTIYFAGTFVQYHELMFTSEDTLVLSIYACGIIISSLIGIISVVQNIELKIIVQQILMNQLNLEDITFELHKIDSISLSKIYRMVQNKNEEHK